VSAISVEMAPEEALKAVLESPYTRYPVYRESLDEIVGILHVRDLVSALHDSAIAEVELTALLRPAYVVPETKDLAALLASSGARTSTCRSSSTSTERCRASSRSRTCWRRSSARSKTSSTSPTSRSSASMRPRSDRRHLPIDDFNEELGTDDRARGLPHRRGYVFDLIGRAAEPGDEV
jgi:CBS domain containing-hemolysin-like protein